MKKIRQTIIIAIVTLINIFAVALWMYLSLFIKELWIEAGDLRVKVTESELAREESINQKKTMAEITKKKKELDNAFVDRQNIVDAIEKIEYVAETTGVSLETKGIVENVASSTALFQIIVSGEFKHIYHSIVLFENMPYMSIIDIVNLQRSDKTKANGPILWQANIQLTLKTLKENK